MSACNNTAAVTNCGAEAVTFEAMEQLLTAGDPLADELAATVDKAQPYADYRRLASEQAPLRRSLTIDSLLYGRILDRWTVWEIANQLRLPCQGPFVVIAADVPVAGDAALGDIESKLRSLDVYSAWHLLPDIQVGIVHIKSEPHRQNIMALLSRTATGRVGISAPYHDLPDTPQAFHVAKVMLRLRVHSTSRVTVFDGSILATAAVSAPAAMVRSAAAVLTGFDDLDEAERQLLFETFRVWQECDASVRVTAERLFCHPNTVRYRLRRIEQRSGRSLSHPRGVAELCLAFEVQLLLM